MAIPTAPTLVTICTEGLQKAGFSTTTSQWTTLLARAEGQWMEEIKNGLWHLSKKLTALQTEKYHITTNGLSIYSNPSDFSSHLSMDIMSGSVTGKAQGGDSLHITLDAACGLTESDLLGKEVFNYDIGGSMSQIVAYNSTTKVATVSPVWSGGVEEDNYPNASSHYVIIDSYFPIEEAPITELSGHVGQTIRGLPRYFYPTADKFVLYPTPYNSTVVYGIKHRYYANLMKLDLAGTLMAKLYQDWQNVFIYGIYAKVLEAKDDERFMAAMKEYQGKATALITREAYGMDLSNITCTVDDY